MGQVMELSCPALADRSITTVKNKEKAELIDNSFAKVYCTNNLSGEGKKRQRKKNV